ncbi:MAG: glycosyltransferase family 4 protein [Rhodocyclaceae bacterium]|nr:glycosyltransferase family 4 protein [Rhodocyclaceae bacterium]
MPPPPLLLLTTSYPSVGYPASGVFVARLARALAQTSTVVVLTPASDGSDPLPQWPGPHAFRYAPRRLQTLAHAPGGIPVALAAHPMRKLLVAPFLVAMAFATWRLSSGAGVLIGNWTICGVVAGLVGRLRGKPVVAVLRGEDANRAGKQVAYGWLLRTCLRLCSATVTVSEAMGEQLRTAFPGFAERIRVIPNGVSDDFLAIPGRTAPSADLRLLFVGSLIPRKSPMTTLDALAALPAGTSLRFVGEGPEQGALERAISERGLARRVEILPFQPAETLPDLMAEADILILSSFTEGRPNVVVEAFAAGLPVAASDIPGVRELIGDDERGVLFPPGDAAALAQAVRTLAAPPRWRVASERGRAYVETQGLSWSSTARRYQALAGELISERNG